MNIVGAPDSRTETTPWINKVGALRNRICGADSGSPIRPSQFIFRRGEHL